MTAAPVLVSKGNLRAGTGLAAGVILNSGNANAATGEPGVEDAVEMCSLVAGAGMSSDHVLVPTGLIGYRLLMDPIREAVPELLARRRIDGAGDAAEAIRTTDTVRKEVTVQGDGFTVGGMAKGAAMLSPHLATMLAVLTTDAEADAAVLTAALGHAVSPSFNELSVDGASSTNDTVLLLANGRAGSADPAALDAAVSEACASLAQQMNADAEGATKQVEIHVSGAATDEEGGRPPPAVAESQLTKCSWYGEDPTGAGRQRPGVRGSALRSRAGADLLRRHCGGSAGMAVEHDEQAVAEHLAQREIVIHADLGIGPAGAGS